MVTGVKPSPSGTHIDAVLFRPTSTDSSVEPQSLSTILFADCTGPSAIATKYLPAASASPSWGPFPRHHYNPVLSYTGAISTVPEDATEGLARSVPEGDFDFGRWDQMAMLELFSPTHETGKAGYAIQKVDGNKLVLIHAGWGLDNLSTNFTMFTEAVEEIQTQTFGADSLQKTEREWVSKFLTMVGEVFMKAGLNVDQEVKFVPYKLGECQWIEYEAANLPANFVAIGDARMRVNPIFGQGTSKLLGDVTFLNSTLRSLFPSFPSGPISKLPSNFSTSYFSCQVDTSKGYYDLTRMLDYGYPTTIPQEDETLEFGGWFRKYWIGLVSLINRDPKAALTLAECIDGVIPGLDLFHPSIAAGIFFKRWFW